MIITPFSSSPCTAPLSHKVGPLRAPWMITTGRLSHVPVGKRATGTSTRATRPGGTIVPSKSKLWPAARDAGTD